MNFSEPLPAQCPPSDASDVKIESIFRILESDSVSEDSFKSHAALGKILPSGIDECRWASCSLVFNTKTLKKLPKFRDCKWAAELMIPIGSGLSKRKNNHVDFWCAKRFSMHSAVVKITEI